MPGTPIEHQKGKGVGSTPGPAPYTIKKSARNADPAIHNRLSLFHAAQIEEESLLLAEIQTFNPVHKILDLFSGVSSGNFEMRFPKQSLEMMGQLVERLSHRIKFPLDFGQLILQRRDPSLRRGQLIAASQVYRGVGRI